MTERPAEYRVLARKYRPKSFGALIGHDSLVRTLTNAFSSGRIAHAFMLTGVRGVGKTTTARLIARALNCVNGPTMDPCGVCDACKAIAEDRHPDVIEMDAASRTGVDDMRELIDGVRYRPVSARYKIYIIDEVHMLSKAAFNALLKTLEEPPPDIKFVFATTEINKVPVTVLSRCQRYTLPRIAAETLSAYYGEIAGHENVTIEPGALTLIARAADGSVRDGLSILDQAIALGMGGMIDETAVREMLGVADRGLTFDLLDALFKGDAAAALGLLETLYNGGTDPAMVLQDLLEVTHFVTRLKLERDGDRATVDDAHDRARGQAMAQRLGIAALSRAWQMLLKGLAEVQSAPQPLKAAEMALIRLIYVADLPPPGDLLKALQTGAPRTGGATQGPAPRADAPAPRPVMVASGGAAAAIAQPAPAVETGKLPASFAALMALVAEKKEAILYGQLAGMLHLVRFEPGQIEFRPTRDAPRDLAAKLGKFLLDHTGTRWMISLSQAEGAPTMRQQDDASRQRQRAEVEADPLVQAALSAFPGATISRVVDLDAATALPEVEPVVAAEPPPPVYEEDDPGPFIDPDFLDGDEDPTEDR